ncbi:hypothetical protein DyAD56_04450 [Dyella sp. AD56]|uniref:AAA family ATPase n=1 Tax=Dyella sp. AD56 TaxID=1528744 RepID=UPI000CCA198E|nr:AAA family ATPase [Dyella sp. AD56]PMQ06721.1 hypothetical protein DyAD56_04450 [Dyella sp. AD56]
MINAFQVNNLRSISDSGVIRLAKINVLVGKNSAGKSTLLRVLPLLRQSVEQPTKAPILWYGRLVDFGTYQNAVSSFAREQGVKFDFYMNLSGDANTGRSYEREYLFGSTDSARIYKSLPKVKVSLTIGLDDDDDVGRARSIEVDLGPDLVKVTESPRDWWRLQLLRRWSHEEVKQVLT